MVFTTHLIVRYNGYTPLMTQVPQHTAHVLEYCSSLKMAMVCSCNVKVHLKPNIQQLAGNKFAYDNCTECLYSRPTVMFIPNFPQLPHHLFLLN